VRSGTVQHPPGPQVAKHLLQSGTMVGGVFGTMPSRTWAGLRGLEPCNAHLALKWPNTCHGLEPWQVACLAPGHHAYGQSHALWYHVVHILPWPTPCHSLALLPVWV
jgi:hypothetical protein